ncbi:MAG TPA: thiol reductant ABC exporter subunit CydC [Rubrobacteraceae bacterium]|nr:thiol reductant ABC exporter subunit CydC [Rubrobacteraceae bacterium]
MRTFLRLLGLLWPYKWRVALAVSLGVATVASNVGLLAGAAYVISAAAIVPYLSLLVIPVYLVRLFSVSRAGSRYAERLLSHDVTFKLLANLRIWFYAHLEPLAPARLLHYRSGDLLSRIVKDVEELENVYLRSFSPVVVALSVSLLAGLAFYLFSLQVALVALAFLGTTGVGVPLLSRALARGIGRRQLRLRAELSARILDDVQGVRDILAFGREDDERHELAELQRKLGQTQRRMARITGLQNSLTDLMMNLALVAVLVLAIPLVDTDRIDGVYLAFLALVMLGCFEAIAPLGTAFQFLDRSLGAGERLFEVVDAEPEVTDPPRPSVPPADNTLEFDGVSFRYEADGQPALEYVTFTLKPGGRLAVVGPSGSGKSTLVGLILRYWDPGAGEVRLGGNDIREYAQEDLRARIGVVSQNTHVFSTTLRENLLLADPGATDEQLHRALETAQLGGPLARLPAGLEGRAGEQGSRLSGGERQRLSVARAMLEDAPLLVLDEATANLDTITERELMAGLRNLMRDRTTITITHRLVGMEEMDEILVLDRGRIVERGTHEELDRAGGVYRRMLDVQRGMLELGSIDPGTGQICSGEKILASRSMNPGTT